MGLFRKSKTKTEIENLKTEIDWLSQKLDKLTEGVDEQRKQLQEIEYTERLRDNAITAVDALAQVKEREEASASVELSKAFEEIRQAVDEDGTSVRMYEYENTFDGYERKYHLNNLMKLLPNYNYRVTLHNSDDFRERFVEVFWSEVNDKSTSEIDPNKNYILQLNAAAPFGTCYVSCESGIWAIDIALNNEDALDRGYIVKGGRLKDAPDWVKAIKPIEVNK